MAKIFKIQLKKMICFLSIVQISLNQSFNNNLKLLKSSKIESEYTTLGPSEENKLKEIFFNYEQVSKNKSNVEFDLIYFFVETITQSYNTIFITGQDELVEKEKTAWDELEIGLNIYKDLRELVIKYLPIRNSILETFISILAKTKEIEKRIKYFDLAQEIENITEEDLENAETIIRETMSLSKLDILGFYKLDELYKFVLSFSIAHSSLFKSKDRYLDIEMIKYINQLNEFILLVKYVLAKEEILWGKMEFIRKSINKTDYNVMIIQYSDAIAELVAEISVYKKSIKIFTIKMITGYDLLINRGERFSQILTDIIMLIRSSGQL